MTVRRACVIGWPIAHSRSPLIHNYWLRRYDLEGAYERVPVRPEALASFLAELASKGYVGCNVTVPHKETALRQIASVDPIAARIGAVNTIVAGPGGLSGTNTDAQGFLDSLSAALPGWSPKGARVALLGAGGAARAIAVALAGAGAVEIAVFNRTPEHGAAMCKDLGPPLAARPWSGIEADLGDADLLVNATSLGMMGNLPLNVNVKTLKSGAPVVDIVYTPLETALLANARRLGHPVVDGLGMLLHQAVPGFEAWFGVRPEVTPELRALVVADLGGN